MSPEIEKSLATIAKGAGILFVGFVISQLIGIVNAILMGRFLGPGNYGLFNLGMSVMMIFCVLPRFGLGSAIIQVISYNKNKRNDKVIGAIDFSFKFCFGVGIAVSLILFFLAPLIATNIFHDRNLEMVIKALCIAFPFSAFYVIARGVPVGFKELKYVVYNEYILMPILQISIFVITIFWGYRLFGALFAYICATIFASIFYIYITYTKFIPSLNCQIKDKSVKNELISLSWPLFLTGFTMLFMSYTDKLLLGVYMTSADIGIYTAAFAIANLTFFAYSILNTIFLPVITEYSTVKDFSGMQKVYSSVTKWIFMLTFPILIYIFFYSRDVIWLLYGEAFTKGSPALIVLTIGVAMTGLTGSTGGILIAIKKTKLNLLAEITGMVSNVGLNVILIPKFGIIGAAIGTSVSIAVRNISSLGFVYKELKIHPYNLNYIKIIVASLIAFTFVYFLFQIYLGILWTFLIIIPIFLIFYLGLLFKMRCLDEIDKLIMRAILKKVGIMK